jgi:ParB family chromosome partitioning protein
MKTIAIPLVRLRLAETNMRTSHRSAGLEELKASLLVHGQLQPIVVTRAPDGDGFAVVAGARRTLAARALVAEGKWPDTARLAAVRRRAGEAEARELSLAENLQRVAPCAADEALAFARLVGDGADPAALAARFGRPVRYVRQRLALAALSPAVLEGLREGRVALAVAEALTLSASHARQEELLARVLECPPVDAARYVREALRRARLPAGHALPGVLDAYAAAGGTLTRDLFGGADGGLVDDPALFLACQRAVLEAEAERRRDGWAFVEVQDGPQAWSWRGAFSHAVPSLTPEQQALLTRLKRELERPDLTAAERALLEERLDAIEPEYDRSACGVVAVLAPDGAVQWVEGLRRREPDPAPAEENDLPPWEDPPAAGVAAETPEEPKLSAAVREELGAVRTASLQAAVLGTPAMALRLACFALLAPGAGPCGLFGAAHRFPTGAREHHASQAWRRVEEAWVAWAGRLGLEAGGYAADPPALWAALGDPSVDLSGLFAVLVAQRCRLGHGEAGIGLEVARELGASVAADWRPGPAALERLPKALIEEAARAIAPGFARAIGQLRKVEMAERVGRCLEHAGGYSADWSDLTGGAVSAQRGTLEAGRAAAASWLPPGTALPADAAGDDAAGEDPGTVPLAIAAE